MKLNVICFQIWDLLESTRRSQKVCSVCFINDAWRFILAYPALQNCSLGRFFVFMNVEALVAEHELLYMLDVPAHTLTNRSWRWLNDYFLFLILLKISHLLMNMRTLDPYNEAAIRIKGRGIITPKKLAVNFVNIKRKLKKIPICISIYCMPLS